MGWGRVGFHGAQPVEFFEGGGKNEYASGGPPQTTRNRCLLLPGTLRWQRQKAGDVSRFYQGSEASDPHVYSVPD